LWLSWSDIELLFCELLLQGGMTEETRVSLNLASLTEPLRRPCVAPVPRDGLVYDYEVIKDGVGKWTKWSESTTYVPPIPRDAVFSEIIVPTVDTVRYTRLMHLLVTHQKACLFVGPTGTGKSVYITVRLHSSSLFCSDYCIFHTQLYLITISCSSKSRLVLPSWFCLSGAGSPG